jgi:hypothetical protein
MLWSNSRVSRNSQKTQVTGQRPEEGLPPYGASLAPRVLVGAISLTIWRLKKRIDAPKAVKVHGPRNSSELCTRLARELSYETVTPGTGSSITSTMAFSAAASPCCGAARAPLWGSSLSQPALVLVTRFFGAVLAAMRLVNFETGS